MDKITNIKNQIIAIFMIIIIIISSACSKIPNEYNAERLRANVWSGNTNGLATGYADKLFVPNPDLDAIVNNISAESYYASSTDRNKSGFVRYKNPYKQMPIASLTKLMTALVVFENCDNFDQKFTVSDNAINLERNASKANLMFGDKVSVKDLLYGLLLPSGNDAAIVLSENIDGSTDNFLLLMNNTAERIGALHSHFSNAHGLDSEYHYSTSYDLYLIMTELLKFPMFKEITSKKEYKASIEQMDGTKREEIWENTNLFVMGDISISENVIVEGGKTGFTTSAGNCLAILSKSKTTNDEYISIILNASSKNNTYRNTNSILNEASK